MVQPGTAETPAHAGRDVARRVKDAAGDSPYSERVTASGAEQPSPPGFSPVAVHRGTACGNPAKLQGHSDAAGDSSHAPPEPSSPSLYSTALPAAPTPPAASPIAPLLSAQPLSNSVPGVSGGGLTHPGPLAWTGPVGTASGALNASPHGQHAHPSMAAPPSLVLEAVGRAGGQLRCTPSDSSSPCAARAAAKESGGRRELTSIITPS